MKITEASTADVEAICKLVNSAYRGETSRKGWTTEADLLDGIRIDEVMLANYLTDRSSTVLKCLNENDELVGCVYLQQDNERLYLGMLTVLPELQTQGIGKMLLKASEQKAKEIGCNSIVMTVITHRTELIEWYKRQGYKETGEKQPFPPSERFGKPKMKLEFLVLQKNL